MTIFQNAFTVQGRILHFTRDGTLFRKENNGVYGKSAAMDVLKGLCGRKSKRTLGKIRAANRTLSKLGSGFFPILVRVDYVAVGCQKFKWSDVAKLMAMRDRAMQKRK